MSRQRLCSLRLCENCFCAVLTLYEGGQFYERLAKNWHAVLLFHASPCRTPQGMTASCVTQKPSHSFGECLGLVGNQNFRAIDELQSFCSQRG
jgi:hypothetical protein